MNVLNNSSDEVVECPLCMEPLEVDDLNFYPCTCGYQICRFCWHRIRTDENELCPACRKAYPENPADFTPLSQEQIAALKAEKRQRDQQRKQKITENRKHLANVRVVQKNLVFVVGLPPRLADADILKKHEYFGKYGKIHKVVINPSTTYAGVQGPSASAYVTYVHNNDALRAIQCVNNIMIDGRLIKTSLGTTKYCSHFMKNQQCPKADCMYLHELGDAEASFTKEEMHQGKHQEYEKRLHEALIAEKGSINPVSKNGDKLGNSTGVIGQNKEAWPSLSVSPVNKEPIKNNGKSGNKENTSKNDSRKHDKVKNDKKGQKNGKLQNNNTTTHNNNNNSSNHNHNDTSNSSNNNKENSNLNINSSSNDNIANQNGTKDTTTEISSSIVSMNDIQQQQHHQQNNKQMQQQHNQTTNNRVNVDDEIKLIDDLEKETTSSEDNGVKNNHTRSISSSSSGSSNNGSDIVSSISESTSGKSSPGSFPDHHMMSSINTTTAMTSKADTHDTIVDKNKISTLSTSSSSLSTTTSSSSFNNNNNNSMTTQTQTLAATTKPLTKSLDSNGIMKNSNKSESITTNGVTKNILDTTSCLSKLSIFDDNSSFFSSSTSFQPMLKGKLIDNDCRTSMNNQLNNTVSSHLPDLLNGIDGYQNHNSTTTTLNGIGINRNGLIDNPEKYLLSSLNTNEDWEAAFKYVMMRNNKQIEDQEEFIRVQEMQKRNNLINSIGLSQMNGIHDFNTNDYLHGGNDLNRLSQTALFQQQQHHQQHQQHQQQQQQQRQPPLPNGLNQNDHIMNNSIFGTNMSKFFDFHKNQQQQHHQNQHHFMMNGHGNGLLNDHRDHLSMATLLENNRINSQYLDHTNSLIGQQLQKQRLFNKYDQMGSHNQMLLNNGSNNQQQQPQPNRIPKQFAQNSNDDDLGFDPFMETQKALAELMENEMMQQQTSVSPTTTTSTSATATQNGHNNKQYIDNNCQRTRMPPPGFNHMNAFGFGIPRAQGSKILPFMNMGGGNSNQQAATTVPQHNNWPQHLNGGGNNVGSFQQASSQQHQQQINDQMHMGQNQNGNSLHHNKSAYGNMTDWTAMDPAILSFRQFSTYSSHQQQQQQQHTTPDMFMQHFNQQQQSGQGFGHHALPNNILNQQQNSTAQVNYSNWYNSEQNMYLNNMNNVTNGFSNNYDKFSIPMPPGIHSNTNNCISGNRQQKTECIN